jgi:hypothetical protein
VLWLGIVVMVFGFFISLADLLAKAKGAFTSKDYPFAK